MFHLRQFGALLLLLASFVSPAMACMAPEAQMTAAERACCRMMKSECGQMKEMPASHTCCNKAPQMVGDAALKTGTVTVHPLTVAVVLGSCFGHFGSRAAGTDWVQRPELSPPRSPSLTASVLRI
ncbi:MAG: hypothetical protein NVS9B15_00130 [Acidobacteriaceae bacterium]